MMKILIFMLSLTTSVYAGILPVHLPNDAYTLDFNIHLVGLSKNRENKIYEATEVVKKVVSSTAFRNAILGHKFNGRKTFSDNRGLTNSQIYNKILAGAEKLHPFKNNTMDLEIELFTDLKSRTIGFTRTNSPRVWINTKYFNKLSAEKVAANLVHEWLHKLGFSHDVKRTWRRKYSVPYAVGRLVSKLGKKLR